MEPDITIEKLTDWNQLKKNKIETIIDPMIVRSADLWLQGATPLNNETVNIREALSKNIDSLEAFFDTLILAECIPLVDYGITYDSNVGFEPISLYKRVNDLAEEKILYNVHVMGEASLDAREAVENGFGKIADVDKELVNQIVDELSAYDHKWYPNLAFLGELSDEEVDLARFKYGLILFGHFSSMANVGHLIQSKRSRFFVAGSVGAKGAPYEIDSDLRYELKKIVESTEKRANVVLDLDACPSFLPYLFSQKPKSVNDIINNAIKLRKMNVIKDYRQWRKEIISNWQLYGRIEPKVERDLRKATKKVLKELGIEENNQSTQLGLNIFFVSAQATVEKLFGWLPIIREGHGHIKILMRTTSEAHAFRIKHDKVMKLWEES